MEECMDLIENVFDIAESFMKESQYVFIGERKIKSVSEVMKKEGKTPFPTQEPYDIYKIALLELVGNSINYCYWYGRHDIRPGNASSTEMYRLLEIAFKEYISIVRTTSVPFSTCIGTFIFLLSHSGFPMLEERVKHLKELLSGGEEFVRRIVSRHGDNYFYEHFSKLTSLYSGYGSDIFLKRASLFFLQLYRNFGWFEKSIKLLHVPADYQVPKILNHYGCINYVHSLEKKIKNNIHIPKHTREECEIRAATILACKKLCDLTGWNISDVDGWLWLRRKETTAPFHLTITTDY